MSTYLRTVRVLNIYIQSILYEYLDLGILQTEKLRSVGIGIRSACRYLYLADRVYYLVILLPFHVIHEIRIRV